MGIGSVRAKDRRCLRLEFLEERNLLSVVVPKGIAAEVATAARPITTIQGQVQGLVATAGLYTPTLPGFTSFSGHGTARPIGNVLFSSQHVQTVSGSSVSITNGSGLLIDYKGDKLYVAYSGSGQSVGHRPIPVTLSGTVTSGTRRFLNETGTFTATGNLVPTTGRLYLRFTMTLNAPA